jgi:hypothetical protein
MIAVETLSSSKGGTTKVGVVSSQIDEVRKRVKSFAFLQVTATPYPAADLTG